MATLKYKDKNGQWQKIAIPESGGGQGGTYNGLEVRVFKENDAEYNKEIVRLVEEGKAVGAITINTGVPVTMISEVNVIYDGMYIGAISLTETNSVTGFNYVGVLPFQVTPDGVLVMPSEAAPTTYKDSPLVIYVHDIATLKRHISALMTSHETGIGSVAMLITSYGAVVCDRSQAGNGGWTFEYNANNKRFRSVWNIDTGEEISTTEIPLGSGSGGGGSITLDSEMSDTSENAVSNKVIKEYVDNAAPRQFGEDFSEDFN